MSKHKHRRGCGHTHKATGVVNGVIDGLSNFIGIGRGWVIAGFIVGLFTVPLLSIGVFIGAWYCLNNPEQTQRHVQRMNRAARRAARRMSDAAFARDTRRSATQPPLDEEDFDDDLRASAERDTRCRSRASADDLSERFSDLDERTRSIEEFVASEEYRLDREFKKL